MGDIREIRLASQTIQPNEQFLANGRAARGGPVAGPELAAVSAPDRAARDLAQGELAVDQVERRLHNWDIVRKLRTNLRTDFPNARDRHLFECSTDQGVDGVGLLVQGQRGNRSEDTGSDVIV